MGSISYPTLLPVCAAVPYSRSQVQQPQSHMTLEEGGEGGHMMQAGSLKLGGGVYIYICMFVCAWLRSRLGVRAVVWMTLTT